MSNDEPGWRGKKVKHTDGRTGVIRRDYSGHHSVTITIRVDGTEDEETIELNSHGRDYGAKGWQWMWARDGDPEAWAFLGDHNKEDE